MNTEQDIYAELEELGSSLLGLPRNMPHTVPPNYFSLLENEVTSQIYNIDVETGHHLQKSKAMPYLIPDGYFETLTEKTVIAMVDNVEGAIKTLPFAAPAGYFDNLPSEILAKTAARPTVKFKKINILPYIKWSLAAILVLGIGLISHQTFYAPIQNSHETILASAADSEINDYISKIEKDDAETTVDAAALASLPVNNTEIVEYLNETGWD